MNFLLQLVRSGGIVSILYVLEGKWFMYCKNCDNNVADGLSFCDACGADLNADALADFNVDNVPPYISKKITSNKLSIVSVIFGISSLVLNSSWCLSGFPIIGLAFWILSALALPSAITGLITGIISNKKSKPTGMKNPKDITGIITSVCSTIIALSILLLTLLLVILVVIGVPSLALISIPGIAFIVDIIMNK